MKTCANLMRRICYNNKDNLMAGLICGGWDPYEGGQVYEVPLGGTIMRQKFAIGGSGSTYIYGLVDATYKEGMTKAECQAFVKKCTSLRSFRPPLWLLMFTVLPLFLSPLCPAISHAMARDGSSGGVIRLVTIDQTGVAKECVLGNDLPFMP